MEHTNRWRWAAVAVLAGTSILAACGSDDEAEPTVAVAPEVADVSGSDEHLTNIAEAGESQSEVAIVAANRAAAARLAGEADRYERAQQAKAAREAAAEAENQAHLDGQARTYGQ
jgi:hypothetical protein